MFIRCKICGIRSEADLEVAVRVGADAVGFICGVTHFSEDALSKEQTRALVRATPPFVSTVLVTHLEDAKEILRLAEFVAADTIQIHGLVDPGTVAEVFNQGGGRRVTKAIHVTGPDAIDDASQYFELCDALQLDSRTSDRLGGTGQVHDWSISKQIVQAAKSGAGLPVVLSGGLTPKNVMDAIATVEPFAVDVNSGVEDAGGEKHPDLSAEFVDAAHSGLPIPRLG